MLKIHFLDVAHGDAIVLEFRHFDEAGNETREFGVMDSNIPAGGSIVALDFLREQGAQELSFVALTHPHTDQHLGLPEICAHFDGRIDAVYTFPLNRSGDKISSLMRHYKAQMDFSKDSVVARNGLSFLRFLSALSKHSNWHDPSGPAGDIPVAGFPGVVFKFLLPPSAVRRQVVERLMDGGLPPDDTNLNQMSMAWLIEYAGRQVVLGGDGTAENWLSQNRGWQNLANSTLILSR